MCNVAVDCHGDAPTVFGVSTPHHFGQLRSAAHHVKYRECRLQLHHARPHVQVSARVTRRFGSLCGTASQRKMSWAAVALVLDPAPTGWARLRRAHPISTRPTQRYDISLLYRAVPARWQLQPWPQFPDHLPVPCQRGLLAKFPSVAFEDEKPYVQIHSIRSSRAHIRARRYMARARRGCTHCSNHARSCSDRQSSGRRSISGVS